MLTDVIQFIFIGEVNERFLDFFERELYAMESNLIWRMSIFSVIATMPKWLTHDLTIDIIQRFVYAMLRTLTLRTLLVRENVFLRV